MRIAKQVTPISSATRNKSTVPLALPFLFSSLPRRIISPAKAYIFNLSQAPTCQTSRAGAKRHRISCIRHLYRPKMTADTPHMHNVWHLKTSSADENVTRTYCKIQALHYRAILDPLGKRYIIHVRKIGQARSYVATAVRAGTPFSRTTYTRARSQRG